VATVSAARNRSIDVVRGVVMVIMALDHAYDMFGGGRDAFDVATTSPAHFYTRWISNICAPVFIAFAGTAMFLAGRRGKSLPEISTFLVKRGLWLILLELTIVRFAWLFDLRYHFILLQIMWVIGCSMLCLAALVWLPRAALVALGVVLVALHDLFDRVTATGVAGALLAFLHRPGEIHAGARLTIGLYYPLVPWVGVMALGYAAGPIVLRPGPERRALYVRGGLVAIALFLLLRALDVYGDPRPWSMQRTPAMTVISFLRCEKYPPSLLFLLMTLGPALLLLAWADRREEQRGAHDRFFDVLSLYGRTPLFFYVAHLLALRLGSTAYAFLCRALHGQRVVGLGMVYLAWVVVVVGLYPACAAFARLKATNKHPLLAYM
jgi:uncharacterized membrane protein